MNIKGEKNRGLIISILIYCLFGGLIWSPSVHAKTESIRFDGSKMSVDIDQLYLKDVFQTICAHKGFWVKGGSSVLESKISIRFQDLSFQDGLKRILGHNNHILLYDSKKELSGVIIVGDDRSQKSFAGKRSDGRSRNNVTERRRSGVKEVGSEHEITGPSPGSDVTPPSEIELASMVVNSEVTLPGGPITVAEQDLENFKVEKSITPPGGSVEVTPAEIEAIQPTIEDGVSP